MHMEHLSSIAAGIPRQTTKSHTLERQLKALLYLTGSLSETVHWKNGQEYLRVEEGAAEARR